MDIFGGRGNIILPTIKRVQHGMHSILNFLTHFIPPKELVTFLFFPSTPCHLLWGISTSSTSFTSFWAHCSFPSSDSILLVPSTCWGYTVFKATCFMKKKNYTNNKLRVMKALKEKNDRVQSTPKGLSVEQRSINGELGTELGGAEIILLHVAPSTLPTHWDPGLHSWLGFHFV